jgi:hypothetical protein
MNCIKVISCSIAAAMLAGCASSPSGSGGPRFVFSGRSTPDGPYAEVGAEFSTWGDFVALFTVTRWKEPTQTGGTLSWANPKAWSEDAGRTTRVLIGEVVVVATAVAIGVAASDSGGDSGGDPPPPTDPPPDPP